MSKLYKLQHLTLEQQDSVGVGRARHSHHAHQEMLDNFDEQVLHYLHERIINHLVDSLNLEKKSRELQRMFNDFSFYMAPAYKAFEGFLFQIAADLKLPSSGNPNFVGTYFDEQVVDSTIDSLIEELNDKAGGEAGLSAGDKINIKDHVKEMKRFLVHYRHTPAHFHGETIDTLEKADQNVKSIYRIISETIKVLLKAGLVQIREDLH